MSDLSSQHPPSSQAGVPSGNPAAAPSLSVTQNFLAYPFSTDQAYQQGLSSILTDDVLAGKSDAEKAEFRRRIEIFYFNKTFGTSLTLEEVQVYEATRSEERRVGKECRN